MMVMSMMGHPFFATCVAGVPAECADSSMMFPVGAAFNHHAAQKEGVSHPLR